MFLWKKIIVKENYLKLKISEHERTNILELFLPENVLKNKLYKMPI